ncbi:MAG TPA: FKBP-type peptidyl-prolyl cis-trans isomerase [Candidatus Dormibacteraeota bacterium]|nr:FKBP-type peptidyl-prolyl cis-trans isomerase [Candidatus Dormibacteraeota bacterium]
MKTTFWMMVFSLAATSLLADDANVLSDAQSRASYAVGMMMGERWKQQGIDLNDDVFLRGLKDAEAGTNTLMTEKEMSDTLNQFQQEMFAKQKQMRAELGEKNKAEGAAFLATNKNNPDVIALPDGLQYKILTSGSGKTPAPDDTVTVNYRGTFIDGKEFDSSAKAGHPAQFQANHVIPGWTEALTKMKTGSKWELFIPSSLAYGEQGGRSIPPNATLIFEVELLDVKASPPVVPPAPLTSDIIKVPSADEMKKGAKIEVIKPEDAQKLENQQTNQSK